MEIYPLVLAFLERTAPDSCYDMCTCDVNQPHVVEETVGGPGPVSHHAVYKRIEEGENNVTSHACPLCHGTGNDGGGGGGERELEHKAGEQFPEPIAVICVH